MRTNEGISVNEAGRRGGRCTMLTHGHEHYESIGKKGGRKTMEKYGREYFSVIGKKGGKNAQKKRHGGGL